MLQKTLQEFPDWLNWLNLNLQRQCRIGELTVILINNHFSRESIELAIEAFQLNNKIPFGSHLEEIDYLKLSKPYFTEVNSDYHVHQFNTDKLQLYLIYDFLSRHECEDVIKIAKERMNPSTVANPEEDQDYRTSQTAHVSSNDYSIISCVDTKICNCLGIDHSFGELTQIQHYGIGHQYKKHHDFFFPNVESHQRYLGKQGNRTWTFMVYLNDVSKGGGTSFLAIEHSVLPKMGLAVVWNNRYPDGKLNHDTLHAGLPVENGEKVILTKWFREHPVRPHSE